MVGYGKVRLVDLMMQSSRDVAVEVSSASSNYGVPLQALPTSTSRLPEHDVGTAQHRAGTAGKMGPR